MMVATPETPGRPQLGAELRRIRRDARRTVAEVGAALGWSPSKLSRIENSKIGITVEDLDRLITLYGVGDPERGRLIALADQSRQQDWWAAYGVALPDAYEAYIGYEAYAESILTYQPQLVPGLLQTDEYAHVIMQAFLAPDRSQLIGRRMAVRMSRQANVLSRDPPPELCAILDEAVLRRPVGGLDVMRRQFLRLIELSERPAITIQVMPFSVGVHQGMHGPFVVLEFPDGSSRPLVYSEGMTGGVLRTRVEDVRAYSASFHTLHSNALDPDESVKFIKAAIPRAS